MISTRSMVIESRFHACITACSHCRIFNPGFRFRPGPSPRPRYIQLKVYDVDIDETQLVHFDRRYPIPRFIDLSED